MEGAGRVEYQGCAYIIKVDQDETLRSFVLEQLLGHLVKTIHFSLGLLYDPLKGTKLAWGGTFVEQVDIKMVGDGELAGSDGSEEGRFTAAVLTQKTVAASIGEFEGRVGDEDATVEDQAGGCDLDVLACLGGGEDTSGNAIGDAVLVHLFCQALDLLQVGGGGAFALNGVAIGIEFNLILLATARSTSAGLLVDLALGGLLGQSLLLGGGRHFCRFLCCEGGVVGLAG